MRRPILWILAAVLALAGCTPKVSVKTTPPVVVAIPRGMAEPVLTGVIYVKVDDPLKALDAGQARVALVPGKVTDRECAFPYRVDDQILMQGWLDTPLALSRGEAVERLRTAPQAGSVSPGPGQVARGALTDLQPGWRPVPVDGVTPTPQTVSSGLYSLGGLVTVVCTGKPDGVVAQLRAKVPEPQPWITLNVTGDFMLARGVARAIREKGALYPIEKVSRHLSAADLTFTNLESPIGVKGRALPGKQIWFRAAPEAMEILKAAGVDGVTVANNHILDYDSENFLETLDLLKQGGIKYVGGGRDLAEARKPMVLEAKGIRVAFVGYSEFADLFFDWDYPRTFHATDKLPGVPRIQDDWLAEDIKAARSQADVVAVVFHWGLEFVNYPTEEQRRIAHRSIDLGADLVLGYHPHAIQGFELYKGKFIAYSTGNFIMDRQDTDLARESMILDFLVSKEGVRSVSVLPVWIAAEQPYIMTGAEGEKLLQKMRTISGWK